MKLIIEIDEDDYTMCQILAKEMCDTRMKLTDNLKYAISNGIPLDELLGSIRADIEGIAECVMKVDVDEKWALGLKYSLQIIDNYRNEVEVSE